MNDFLIVPNNWKKIRIEDISLKIHYGYTESSTKKNTGVKFLRITDIQKYKVNWEQVPYVEIDDYDIEKYLLSDGDILFARTGATVGKSFLIRGEINRAVFASYLIRIQVSKLINPKFLYYFFQSNDYWKQIGIKATGIGQPNVNASSLSKISFLLSPFEEQNRIVAKIEELFAEIEQAEASLIYCKRLLSEYRYLVTKSAFDGKLTSANGSSDGNEVENNGDAILDGWYYASFETVTHSFNEKRVPLSSQVRSQIKGKYPYYGATEIIDYLNDYKLDGEFLLIGEDGANLVSKIKPLAFIVNGQFWPNNHVHVVKTKPGILLKYLCYYFNTLDLSPYISGTAQPKLNKANLNKIQIPICSIDEQKLVIQEIEYRFTIIENLENVIDESLKKAVYYRQSVLKKAYNGNLLLQEVDDESADVLLSKIELEKSFNSEQQLEVLRLKPKRKVVMEKKKSILEVLKEANGQISAKDVWLQSNHKDDIEAFYSELRELHGKIIEIKRDTESLLSLANED